MIDLFDPLGKQVVPLRQILKAGTQRTFQISRRSAKIAQGLTSAGLPFRGILPTGTGSLRVEVPHAIKSGEINHFWSKARAIYSNVVGLNGPLVAILQAYTNSIGLLRSIPRIVAFCFRRPVTASLSAASSPANCWPVSVVDSLTL